MSEKTAAILGSTGMIGTYLLDLLLSDNYFSTVRVLVRQPRPKTDEKLEVKLVNYEDAESIKLALEGCDVIFSCIGTTQKNVKGDKELYRKIDFDIPVRAARFGKQVGCEKMVLVTAVGANKLSRNFYLRLKGELEDELAKQDLFAVHVMQPSMLLGERKEHRPAEKFFQGSTKLFSFLLAGNLRKYRAIEGKTVATAMMNAAKIEDPGFFVYTYDEIKRIARSY